MSREQWGHGYWAGYKACGNEEEKLGIKKPTDYDVILSIAKSVSSGKTYASAPVLITLLTLTYFDTEQEAIKAIKKCEEKFDCGLTEDGKYFTFVDADAIEATNRINDYAEAIAKKQK